MTKLPFYTFLLVVFAGLIGLASCGGGYSEEPQATPTVEDNTTVDLAATMVFDRLASDATQQAIEQAALQQEAAMTSTAISINATATQQSAMATAHVADQRATATQGAFVVQATASKEAFDVQATQTQQAWVVTATIDAYYTNLDLEHMVTQQAAETIRMEGESAQIVLAVERQQIKNKADAILPWSIVVAALIIAGAWMYRRSQIFEATRNVDGTYNLPIFRTSKGYLALKPENMAGAGAALNIVDGEIIYQDHPDADQQKETTYRAQATEALRALPPGRDNQAMQVTANTFGNTSTTPATIEVLPPEQTREIGPVLDEFEGQVLDE